MPLRDIILALLLVGGLPAAMSRPIFGALVFVWLGMMNPHRYTWSFAYDFPWSKLYAAAVLIGVLVSKEPLLGDSIKRYRIALVMVAWMLVTTVFALEPMRAWNKFADVLKIHLMIVITLALLTTRVRITMLVAVMTLSVAFYGTKGGIFTLVNGGEYKVFGPMETAIQDNNHLATGLVMITPLLYWLFTVSRLTWQKLGLLASILLCAVSVFGSHSRGAFLAVGAMAAFFVLKSDRKLLAIPLVAIGALASVAVMPEKYWARMETIQTYEQDASAQGRINAWKTAYHIANDRITGGGLDYYSPRSFARYAPNPLDVHASHSIYFQSLGEHGWIGLILFLAFWLFVWRQASRGIAELPPRPENDAMRRLLRMAQVSMLAYAVGGAFVNIGNWDFAFYLAAVVMAVRRMAKQPARAEPMREPMVPREAFATRGPHTLRQDLQP